MSRAYFSVLNWSLSTLLLLVQPAAAQDAGFCPYGGPCAGAYRDYDYNLYDYDYADVFGGTVAERLTQVANAPVDVPAANGFESFECDEFYSECECWENAWAQSPGDATWEDEVDETVDPATELVTGYDDDYDNAMCGIPAELNEMPAVGAVDEFVDNAFPEYDCFYGCFDEFNSELDVAEQFNCVEHNTTASDLEQDSDPFAFPGEEDLFSVNPVPSYESAADEWWVLDDPIDDWDCESATCHTVASTDEEDCSALLEAAEVLDGMAATLINLAQTLREAADDIVVAKQGQGTIQR